MSKIFGTHRTVFPVVENLDQDYLTFTNDKIKFDGIAYNSPYTPSNALFPGVVHTLQTYSNTLTKNGSTYNFYRWEDENVNLISTNSQVDVKIDNHRYRAMFAYVPPPPPQYVIVNIKNEFKDPNNTIHNGGTVNIDNEDYENTENLPGQQVTETYLKNSVHRFEAKEQAYPEGSYYRGFNPRSDQDGGWVYPNLITRVYESTITPQVIAGPYTAKYRNRYNAYVNGSAAEDNGFIANIFPTKQLWQYESEQISAPPDHIFPGGLTGYFSYWTDGSVQNLRNISPSDNTTYTAVYKYISRSNNQNAYANNGQRKFVRTNNGILFNLYESINRVWLEKSTDGGSTWVIANQGKPLANHNSKNPSMCFTYADVLYIVFEDDNANIRLYKYDCEYDVSIEKSVIYSSTYLTDTNPVVTYCFNDYESPEGPVVIWKSAANDGWGGDPGLYYAAIDVTNWNNYTEGMIPNTNMNSYNPSIAGNDPIHQTTIWKSSPMIFNFVWEQRNGENSSIMFYQVQRNSNSVMDFRQYQNISDGFGYSKNYNPSIVTIKDGTDNFTARVCWIAYRRIAADGLIEGEPGEGDGPGDPASLGDTKVFYRRNNNQIWSTPSSYGNNINTVNINKNSNNTFAFAWSEGSGNINKFVKSNDITTVYNTNTTGRYIQVGNYINLDAMRLNSFTTSTQPYYFTLSNTFNTMPEAEEIEREVLIVQDTTAFYYSLGGITVDNQSIDFIEIPDSVILSSQEELNSYLVSEPFNLTESSSFTYGVKFGVTDSLSAASSLSGGKFVQFKVELIEDQTGDVLGVFDNVTFNSENIVPYESNAYQVNLQGIGNKICRLKLKTNSTLNFGHSLIKSYNNEVMLAKRKLQTKSLDELGSVTTYALEQNFPNPFNPSTIIRYQIPNDGIVKLKIFNILGQEILTLVNEEKTVGRYEVNFDASKFASGVYIYKLQAGDYINSKKMILLK